MRVMILKTERFRGRVTILLVCTTVLLALLGSAAPTEPAITTGSGAGARDYYVRISKLFGFEAKPGVTTADYQEDEYMLIGMAIKHAGLRGKEARVIVKNRSPLGEEDKIQ